MGNIPRHKRRVNVTLSESQIELIKLGVELGMALNEADYVRRAVDELNEKISSYKQLREFRKNGKE